MRPFIAPISVFVCLSYWSIFNTVYLDSDSVVSWNKNPQIDSEQDWSNKIDLSTDTLYVNSLKL